MKIIAYTDGAASGNPGPGGYGAVVMIQEKNYKKEYSQGFKLTTNNRMELLAVIKVMEIMRQPKQDITIVTDSKYVCDSVEKGWVFAWEKKDFAKKKNVDLWKQFLKFYRQHTVKLKWIKGHAGHHWNEVADKLAVKASQSTDLLVDKGYVEQME